VIGRLSTNCCVLYTTFAVKYRAQYQVSAMSYLVPVKSNTISVLLKHASTYNWTYLCCDCWFIDKSMRVILHICCQIMPASSCIRYVNNCPGQIKFIYISCYSGINIQVNVSPPILVKCRQFNARYIFHICSHIQPKSSRLRYVKSAPSQIKYNYSFSYSVFNIQLNVSPLLLLVYRQIGARYTPHLLRNTGHSSNIVLCHLWSR
jgi:hypothetical protein